MKRLMLALILLFPAICFAPDIWMDVDTAVVVPVNIYPLTDTDLVIDSGVTYDEAGMALYWNFVTPAGPATVTAVTPTTGSMQDWSGGTGGMYFMEIAASGGDDIDNDTEGTGWFSGNTTATAPFRGPTIGFRKASMNDLMVEDGTAQDNMENQYDGTGYAGGTINSQSDMVKIHGSALTETVGGYLAAGFVKLFDVETPLLVASDVMRGTNSANTTVPDAAGVAPTAAEIKTEVEQAGSSLAQILEDTGTTLDDLFDAIITHLLDLKGTDFAKDTHSLPQCLTSAATDIANATHTYVILDGAGNGIADVLVEAKINNVLIQSARTNPNGIATFYLAPATYDFYATKAGYSFNNPDTEAVN